MGAGKSCALFFGCQEMLRLMGQEILTKKWGGSQESFTKIL
jgi:hypothetical protein